MLNFQKSQSQNAITISFETICNGKSKYPNIFDNKAHQCQRESVKRSLCEPNTFMSAEFKSSTFIDNSYL